jgi:hypothetical protein
MMCHSGMDNGEWMMRRYGRDRFEAQQLAQQRAMQQAISDYYTSLGQGGPSLTPRAWSPGERPEPEDTTGLKMLEEFLTKRKGERDGDERK